jgi:hypothetical protein
VHFCEDKDKAPEFKKITGGSAWLIAQCHLSADHVKTVQ